MPLFKRASKKALQHNIEAEMDAHPSPAKRAQNLAIAYNVQKQARKKKMAEGGEVDREPASDEPSSLEESQKKIHDDMMMREMHNEQVDATKAPADAAADHRYSDGGFIEDDEQPHCMADAIMAKRKAKMMSEGGMAEIEDNAKEEPYMFQDMNQEAMLKEDYSEDLGSMQPEDSNEMRPSIDEDDHDQDMISRVRSRMRMKR